MSIVDIDVIAKGGPKDQALAVFHSELKNQQALAKVFEVADEKKLVEDVITVFDMVERILKAAGARSIRRLRIFGHGSEGTIQVGPFVRTGRRVEDTRRPGAAVTAAVQTIDQADLTQVIKYLDTTVYDSDGRFKERVRGLTNEPTLRRLVGRFAPGGWVELHSCRIAGPDGKDLIKALAHLWRVEVHASEDKQHVGGGLEGKVWIARPSGTVIPK